MRSSRNALLPASRNVSRGGFAYLILTALIVILSVTSGAAIYLRVSQGLAKPPMYLKLQADYQLESAIILVFHRISLAGPVPVPPAFQFDTPRREIIPGAFLTVRCTRTSDRNILIESWIDGNRLERRMAARATLPDTPSTASSTTAASATWNLQFIPFPLSES